MAPKWYSISDPAAANIVYGFGKSFAKSEFYYGFTHPDPSRWTLFSDRNSKNHSVQRRKVASAYSMTALVQYEPFVDKCAAILCQRLSEFVDAGKEVHITHWLQCYAFDVIGEITVRPHPSALLLS